MIELDSKPISKDLFWSEFFLVTWVLVQSKSVCAARKSVWNWMWQQSLPFPRSSFCFQKFLKIQYNTRVLDSRDSCCKKTSPLCSKFLGSARGKHLFHKTFVLFVCQLLQVINWAKIGSDQPKGQPILQIWMNFRKVFQSGVTSNPKVVIVDFWCSKWAFDHDLWEKMQEGSYPWGATWVINAWQSANITIITTLHSNVTNVATEIAIPIQFPSHPSWTLESFLSNFELQDLQGLTHGVALDHPGHFEKSYHLQFNLA